MVGTIYEWLWKTTWKIQQTKRTKENWNRTTKRNRTIKENNKKIKKGQYRVKYIGKNKIMKEYFRDLLLVFLAIETFLIGLAILSINNRVNELERRIELNER